MGKQPSGRFVLRLTPQLHGALRSEAARQGLSLNELVLNLLRDRQTGAGGPAPDPAVEKLREWLGPSLLGVVLFGSTARDEAGPDSDIDLLVVLARDIPLNRDLYRRWDETGDGRTSPHFVHLPDGPAGAGSIWFEAAVDGIVLYDPGRAVARFLARTRRAMARGSIQRKSAYGHPYWIRQRGEADHAQ